VAWGAAFVLATCGGAGLVITYLETTNDSLLHFHIVDLEVVLLGTMIASITVSVRWR
jgi:hypothetical protein